VRRHIFLYTQIETLPLAPADVALNSSSQYDTRMDRIRFYFQQFDRLPQRGDVFYGK
jgi:hypothetical protein